MAKKNGKANGASAPEAQPQETQAPAGVQMSEEQKYLNDLLSTARTNPSAISPEQKLMIEMLAAAEQKVVAGTEQAQKIQQQINQLQAQLQQLDHAISAERGTARSFAQALLTLRAPTSGKTKTTQSEPAPATVQ